jgi:hypothetical protein
MGPASQTATVTTRPVPPPPPIPSSPPVSAAPIAAAPIATAVPGAANGSPKSSSSKLNLLLGLVAVMFVAVAAAGGWWWWTNRHQAASPTVAQTPAPETTAPAPPAKIPPLAPVPAEPATSSSANILNNASILEMVQANTPTPEIVKKIRSSKTDFNLSKEEISRLKQAGVPAIVIQAMRNPTGAPASPTGSTQVAEVPPLPPVKAETPAVEAPKPAPRHPTVALAPVTVNDALPFRIVLTADVPSDAPEGQPLSFTVVDGLQVDNNTVIAKGATVTGFVSGETGKKKILGMGGGSKLTFRLAQSDAVDGKKLTVRAMSGRRAEGPTIRTFETLKGSKTKGLAAAQGTEYIAYIDGEQTVSVRKQ